MTADPVVEHDTFVIVPGRALMADLVRIALVRIGYNAAEASRARGVYSNTDRPSSLSLSQLSFFFRSHHRRRHACPSSAKLLFSFMTQIRSLPAPQLRQITYS